MSDTIIAHLLHFASEADAFTALEGMEFTGWRGQPLSIVHHNGETPTWDQSFVVANQTITTSPAVWDRTDPDNPVLVSPAVTEPGFTLTVYLPALAADLQAHALIIYDQTARNMLYRNAPVSTATVSPMFADLEYPFGG